MPLSKASNRIRLTFLVVAFLGFIDAAYLTVHHYIAIPLPCTIFKGCDIVTTSVYSTIGFVPVALAGALYYMSAFFLMLLYREFRLKALLYAVCALVGTALAASIWFLYVQGFILHSWCQYCVLSAIITTILATLSALFLLSEHKT